MNRIARLFSLVALTGTIAYAQQTPPPAVPAPGAPQGAPAPHGRMGGGPGGPGMRGGKDQHEGGMEGRHEGMRGGMHGEGRIVPPGMWWKSPEVATRIGLTPEQTKKMDDIFQSSRLKLIDLKANVEKQEVTLEPMLSANPIDSKAALVQIGKVAEARAELEKATAGMLLGIRAILTPEQWTKLHDHDHAGGPRRPGMGKLEGPGRPMGPDMAMTGPADAESAQ